MTNVILRDIRGLAILSNNLLQSLSGLENIHATTIGGLEIEFNPLLSVCEITSICNYLNIPGGFALISQNAPGCLTSAEVQAACEEVGVEDYPLNRNLIIYPNPANRIIFIETPEIAGDKHLEIINGSGQQMMKKKYYRNIRMD